MLSLSAHQIQPQKLSCKGHQTSLVLCKVWLVFGPGKSLFSHILLSNKLVSFWPSKKKISCFVFSMQVIVFPQKKNARYCSSLFPLRKADITAAIGLCLEKLTKKELETTKDVLNSILQGVSCESPPTPWHIAYE